MPRKQNKGVMSPELRKKISERVRNAIQKRKEDQDKIVLSITFTPESLARYFNDRFGYAGEFTPKDVIRNFDGINDWILAGGDEFADYLFNDFDSCAADWGIDLFD